MNAPLLSLQFDQSGCTDTRIVNLGGVSFNKPSPIYSNVSYKGIRCAYFEPQDDTAGFYIKPSINLKSLFASSGDFTIYFKYKIHRRDMKNFVPILTFRKEYEPESDMLLYIQNKRFFRFDLTEDMAVYSRDVTYTFDGNWHTFCLVRSGDVYKFFVDGLLGSTYTETDTIDCGEQWFIGWHRLYDKLYTFGGGCIDDFNIVEAAVYDSHFIPPTEYFWANDIIDNYTDNSLSNIKKVEPDIRLQVDKNMEHTTHTWNDTQYGWLPRRMRITWYEDDGHFEKTDYDFENDNRDYTVIHITRVDQPLLVQDMDFYRKTLLNGYEHDEVMPLVVFINGIFFRLSKIELIKSHEWYTLKINGRDPKIYGEVKDVSILILPFKVLYEEDMGERLEYPVLYRFNDQGRFDEAVATSIYYLDTDRSPGYRLRTFEQYFPDLKKGAITKYTDSMFMHSIWRYGVLEPKRTMGSNPGDGAYVYFLAWDNGYVQPGDHVILYKNTVMIDPEKYRIVAHDLLYFDDWQEAHLSPTDTITMQIITDGRARKDWLFEDVTESVTVEVEPEFNMQSVFKIPEVYAPDGTRYWRFLLFRGSVCMDEEDRYEVDYDEGTIRFTNIRDYVTIGRKLYFIFVNIKKTGAYGNYHLKPVFLYARPYQYSSTEVRIKIPDLYGLRFNMNNVMIFNNDVFIQPNRYMIIDNEVVFKDLTNQDNIHAGSVTRVIGKDGNGANVTVTSEPSFITFCLLRIVDDMEDPQSLRDKIIRNQLLSGGRYILFDTNIDKHIKLTLDNFVTFDEEGKYISDLWGKVYNLNIIKQLKTESPSERTVRYLTIVYHEDWNKDNWANIVRPDNTYFLKRYVRLYNEFHEMDINFDDFMSDFNTRFSKSLSYGENLSKALDYMVTYNQSVFNPVYEKRATAFRRTYDMDDFTNNLTLDPNDSKYHITMERDKYIGNKYRTFLMFFENGVLADWNKDLRYKLNEADVALPVIPDKKTTMIESLGSRHMKNFLIPMKSRATAKLERNFILFSRITVGQPFSFEFNSRIEVQDKLEHDLPSTIEVIPSLPEKPKNEFHEDVFNDRITVAALVTKDITSIIYVEDVPQGTTVDLSRYTEIYDIYTRIEVGGSVNKDIDSTIEVDGEYD